MSTEVVTVASATEGRQGYGFALHEAPTASGALAVSQAASVVGGVDGMWQVRQGGAALFYCEGGANCRRVSVEVEGAQPLSIAILSPGTLWGFPLSTRALAVTEPTVPVTRHRGIWAATPLGLFHCRVESGSPACHFASYGDAAAGWRIPLALFVVNDADVVWIAQATDIFRCESGATGTTTCAKAQIE